VLLHLGKSENRLWNNFKSGTIHTSKQTHTLHDLGFCDKSKEVGGGTYLDRML
jgi:hypothetical protein